MVQGVRQLGRDTESDSLGSRGQRWRSGPREQWKVRIGHNSLGINMENGQKGNDLLRNQLKRTDRLVKYLPRKKLAVLFQ